MLPRHWHPNARTLAAAATALVVVLLLSACTSCDASRLDNACRTRTTAVANPCGSGEAADPVRLITASLPAVPAPQVAAAASEGSRHTAARVSRSESGRSAVRPAPVALDEHRDCTRPSRCPQLRNCENGGTYGRGTSWPRFFGAYQFDHRTWLSNGGTEANWGSADVATQDANADLLFSRRGRGPWPMCGRYLRG